MDSIRQIFQLAFDQKIKCIHHQEESKFVVVEIIGKEPKIHQLFLLNLQNLEIVESFELTADLFGCTLKSFDRDRLVLVKYSTEYNPDRYDVFVHDWRESKLTGQWINTQILDSGAGWIELPHPHFENRRVYIDITQGIQLESKPETVVSDFISTLVYPNTYPSESKYFSWFEKYLNKIDVEPVHQVEHLVSGKLTMLSYYQKAGEQMSNHLIFMNSEGTVLDQFELEQGLSGVGRDTFFVINQMVIFITNQKTLNIYEI